jgi:hypothetical protein
MNAKQEFLQHINYTGSNHNSVINYYTSNVLCVEITIGKPYVEQTKESFLTTGYSIEEWEQFLSDIDKEYDEGYGGQELFGTIWYKDGTWSTRSEYDGSEWWDYHSVPEIPENLNRIDKVRDKKIDTILNEL